MAYALLLLRLVLGGTMAAHGSQKLFGLFGGGGPEGTAGFMRSLRFTPALPLALMVGLAELGGGLLLALGLLTPLGAFAIAAVMLVAIWTVHLRNGYFNTEGGIEFPLLIWTAAVSLAGLGPGRFSVDHALGWVDNLSGTGWAIGVAVASFVAAGAALALGRRPEVTAAELATDQPLASIDEDAADEPLAREREAAEAALDQAVDEMISRRRHAA